jgi:voltage-gated potassium channel
MESAFRRRLRIIIFEADTPGGKAFDVALILAIIGSVTVVMCDSVESLRDRYGSMFYLLEWGFTALFTVEYALRLYCIRQPIKYATSFFGVVDLLAILPTYVSILVPGTHYIAVVRVLRVLRVFRILKIAQYVSDAEILITALRASRRKITIFMFSILSLIVIFGSLMYILESREAGFTSIPRSIYWAIVTLTTVGYGDIAPQTVPGQFLASIIMITGYSIIAVPTGIVTVEIANAIRSSSITTKVCAHCSAEGHDLDADYCKFCGEKLPE